jgi:hypothetical protein
MLGYALIGVGMMLAAILPSGAIGVPFPTEFQLENYVLLRFFPLVPLLAVILGGATIWSVNRLSKTRELFILLSVGYLLTLSSFWVGASVPGSYVKGLGFPLSWILLLGLPKRPVEVLGTSVIAFLFDLVLWTVFLDSMRFALQKRRMGRRFDRDKSLSQG